MTIFKNLVTCFVLAVIALAPLVVQAQDQASTTVGKATVTVGSGIVLMMLPSTGSMITEGPNSSATDFPIRERFTFTDSFQELGPNINASIAVPVNGWSFSINGFWANVKGKDSFSCTPQSGGLCAIMTLVDDPTRMQVQGVIDGGPWGGSILVNSKRKVNNWGFSLESKRIPAQGSHYLAFGLDVRGIYQDLNSTMVSTAPLSFVDKYKDSLNTTYYGGYAAWGGSYSPFAVKGWGLESFFRFQGGVYYADTSYHGRLSNSGSIIGGGGDPTSRLSLSDRDIAFIGGITLGIGKQLGARTKLSLAGGYEYYSRVPRVIYNTADQNSNPFLSNRHFGTRLEGKDGSSAHIGLKLSIEL